LSEVFLFAATSDGHWRPGIGDPTLLGWVTVAAYFAAMLACGRVWRLDLRASRAGETASPTLWLILAVLLGLLGVNKQLDLQSLATDIGRTLAKRQNWYAQRRELQAAFIVGVGAAGLVLLAVFTWLARREPKRNVTALAGIVLLFAFVMIRAASFHHFDLFIQSRFAGVKWNAILELGGISVVAIGAALAIRADRRRSPGAHAPEHPGRDDSTGPRRYRVPGAGPVPGRPPTPRM
jgi:hypothetical protein